MSGFEFGELSVLGYSGYFLFLSSLPETAIYTNLQVCLSNCDYMSIYEAMQKIGKLMFIFQIQRLS